MELSARIGYVRVSFENFLRDSFSEDDEQNGQREDKKRRNPFFHDKIPFSYTWKRFCLFVEWRRRFSHDMCLFLINFFFQDADERERAVILVIVKPIADDKFVGDFRSYVIRRERDLAA